MTTDGNKTMMAEVDVEIWHKRLGHMSESKPHQISFLSSFSHFLKGQVCDCCVKAKLTRLPFPNSSINSSSCFELIHCDI